MAGHSGVHGNACSLLVADFTHENDVRVLTENGTEPFREREVRLRIHLDLIDAFDVVFHRILDGRDIDFRIVQNLQNGVHARRLAGTGRPGREHHAPRLAESFPHLFQILRGKAELFESELARFRRQQTEHDFLALDNRHNGYARIHHFAFILELQLSVLRRQMLVSLQLRQNLYPGHDLFMEFFRQRRDFVQHAVDAKPDDREIAVRLDMEIRRLVLVAAGKQLVDHLHDRPLIALA